MSRHVLNRPALEAGHLVRTRTGRHLNRSRIALRFFKLKL